VPDQQTSLETVGVLLNKSDGCLGHCLFVRVSGLVLVE
jgi:hypothetical protein